MERDIPSNTLSQYEKGRREPNMETLKKIAQYFKVSTDYIIGLSDNIHCPNCGFSYNPLNSSENKEHAKIHSRYLSLKENIGFLYSANSSNNERVNSEIFLRNGNLPDEGQAFHVETLLKADYSDYARNKKYDVDISYKDFCSKAINNGAYLDLISDNAKKILFATYSTTPDTISTKQGACDIKKDLDTLMEKLSISENGSVVYDGENLSPEAVDLFRDELEIALKRLKIINNSKYNPDNDIK